MMGTANLLSFLTHDMRSMVISCMRIHICVHGMSSLFTAAHHPHQRIPLAKGFYKFLFRRILMLCPNTLSRCVQLIRVSLHRLPLQVGVFLHCLLGQRRELPLLLIKLLHHSFNHCHSLLQLITARVLLASCAPENRGSSGFQFFDVLRLFRNLGGKLFVFERTQRRQLPLFSDQLLPIADAIIDLQNREDTSIPAMRQQLKACEKAIENMLNAIQMGILTPSTKTRLEELEAQRESLKVSILQAELEKPKYTKEQIVSWINRFKYGNVDDIEYQRQIIDTFINAIYVYDDKLVFTYNYKDGSATITPEEIEEAFGSDLTQVAPP